MNDLSERISEWIDRISSWAGVALLVCLGLAFFGLAPPVWVAAVLFVVWFAGSPMTILIGALLGLSRH